MNAERKLTYVIKYLRFSTFLNSTHKNEKFQHVETDGDVEKNVVMVSLSSKLHFFLSFMNL